MIAAYCYKNEKRLPEKFQVAFLGSRKSHVYKMYILTIRAMPANRAYLCLIRQFNNFLKGSAVAYCQAFIEGRAYQFFMVV